MKGQAKPCGLPCGQGKKVRARILTQQSQAAQLVPAIKARLPDWHFANNPQNVGELERLVSKMQLSTREFGWEFLRGDTSNVKKQYTPDVQCVHLIGLLAAVVDAQVLQAAKIRVCSVCSANARSPWLVLISEGNLGQRYDVGG